MKQNVFSKIHFVSSQQNNFDQYFQQYKQYDKLQKFLLQHNKFLNHLPMPFLSDKLKNVQKLEITGNKIQNLYQFLKGIHIQKQVKVQIGKQKLLSLPVLNMNISSIYLYQNQLTSIDQFSTKNYTQLTLFRIYKNQLKSIPQLFMPNVKQLGFDQNKIESIEGLSKSKLNLLQQLNLQRNSIKKVGKLYAPKLTRIFMKKNKINDLQQFQLSQFMQIIQIDLNYNQITSFPGMKNQILLKNLRFVNLSNNRIQSIQKITYFNSPNIQILQIQKNFIVHASSVFNKNSFKFLQQINLSNNFIQQLNITRCRLLRLRQFTIQVQNRKRQQQAIFYSDFVGQIMNLLIKLNSIKINRVKYNIKYFEKRHNVKMKYACLRRYGYNFHASI